MSTIRNPGQRGVIAAGATTREGERKHNHNRDHRRNLAVQTSAVFWQGCDGQIVVGPLLWRPDRNGQPSWYFMVGTGGRDGFHLDKVELEGARKTARAAVIASFLARGNIVVHVTGDELRMACLCEMLWPCERTSQLRRNVEAELGVRS
jgi:hypothetical protein